MEYKFRGKRIDNDEWAYGLPLLNAQNICNQNLKTFIIEGKSVHGGAIHGVVPVHPDSVGMWTGLKDKAGVEVYSDDIVRHGRALRVIYRDETASYGLGVKNVFIGYMPDNLEIIGNTTDNPELLGEQK